MLASWADLKVKNLFISESNSDAQKLLRDIIDHFTTSTAENNEANEILNFLTDLSCVNMWNHSAWINYWIEQFHWYDE